MADISRLYDFVAGTPIASDAVDAEFNQLVAAVNDLDAENLRPALAAQLAAGSAYRAKSIIPASETRSSTSYGTLPTPDQVGPLTLPTDGVLWVMFTAQIGGASSQNTQAALFLNGVQLKARNSANPSVVVNQEATYNFSSGGTSRVITANGGLIITSVLESGADVTTGQVLGGGGGGAEPIPIFAAADTYTISVRYATTGGSAVSVGGRKLYAWVQGF